MKFKFPLTRVTKKIIYLWCRWDGIIVKNVLVYIFLKKGDQCIMTYFIFQTSKVGQISIWPFGFRKTEAKKIIGFLFFSDKNKYIEFDEKWTVNNTIRRTKRKLTIIQKMTTDEMVKVIRNNIIFIGAK